jgi:hypothetical protein
MRKKANRIWQGNVDDKNRSTKIIKNSIQYLLGFDNVTLHYVLHYVT